MYAKLIDGKLVFPPNVSLRPNGTTVVGYLDRADLLVADGYKRVKEVEKPGEYFTSSWVEAAEEIVQTWTEYTPAPIPDPVPMFIEGGIETPVLVLQAPAGIGIGVIADDDGGLTTYIDHASPRPDKAVIAARIAAARLARREERDAYLALLDALISGNAKDIKDTAKVAKEKARK
jgi:hypothetical protein